MIRSRKRQTDVDEILDDAIRNLERANLKAVLVMRDLCEQISKAGNR